MTQKTYLLLCGALFFVVAVGHLTRLITGWEIAVAGWAVPRWVSVPGLVVPGALSVWGFLLASRDRVSRRPGSVS